MRMSEEEVQTLLKNNPALKISQPGGRKPPPNLLSLDDMDSDAERRYYRKRIEPALQTGLIARCDLHREFEILPALEHCGQKHKTKVYTPDFFIEYRDGTVEVVEVKGRKVKKLQRDYPLRRQLFLLRYCIPNHWRFLEVHDDEI